MDQEFLWGKRSGMEKYDFLSQFLWHLFGLCVEEICKDTEILSCWRSLLFLQVVSGNQFISVGGEI